MPKGIGYPEKKKVEVNKMTREKEVGGKSSHKEKEKTEKHVIKK
jgi:hypothetical protein